MWRPWLHAINGSPRRAHALSRMVGSGAPTGRAAITRTSNSPQPLMTFPQYSRLDTSRLDRSRPVVALTDQWRVYTQPIPGHEMLGTVSMTARGETYTFALA